MHKGDIKNVEVVQECPIVRRYHLMMHAQKRAAPTIPTTPATPRDPKEAERLAAPLVLGLGEAEAAEEEPFVVELAEAPAAAPVEGAPELAGGAAVAAPLAAGALIAVAELRQLESVPARTVNVDEKA